MITASTATIRRRSIPLGFEAALSRTGIEDDGTILYSILTFSLPDASPKVYPG
jgi:hypothetical protein